MSVYKISKEAGEEATTCCEHRVRENVLYI